EVLLGDPVGGVEADAPRRAAAFFAPFGAGVLDKDASHRFRRGEKELRFAGRAQRSIFLEPEEHLVHQRGRLKRVIRALAREALTGNPPKLFVDGGKPRVQGRLTGCFDGRRHREGFYFPPRRRSRTSKTSLFANS